MSSMPTRIDGELFAAAKEQGELMSRSAAQQISHWARLGRELEASGGVSTRDVERVLAGTASYDSLNEAAQAVVRTTWDERIDLALGELDLAAEFEASGDGWSEAAADGTLVRRRPA